MKKVCCFVNTTLRVLAFVAGGFLLIAGMVACKDEKVPDVPKEQSDLLFETFRDLEQKKYESALPKLNRYREIDSTNTLINNMIQQTVTNAYMVQLRALLEQGDFAGAEALMDSMLKQHDALDDRVRIRDFVVRLNRVDQLIRKLAPVQNAKTLRSNAEKLLRELKGGTQKVDLPGAQKIEAYARKKLQSAEELAKIEQDRVKVWPWFDALEAKNGTGKEHAELLRIYVAAQYLDGFGEPCVRELAPGNGKHVSK